MNLLLFFQLLGRLTHSNILLHTLQARTLLFLQFLILLIVQCLTTLLRRNGWRKVQLLLKVLAPIVMTEFSVWVFLSWGIIHPVDFINYVFPLPIHRSALYFSNKFYAACCKICRICFFVILLVCCFLRIIMFGVINLTIDVVFAILRTF